ncbi:serine hydrolase-like protein [Clavelina lepadiformis]|uniref:serine hydrolase-like protein n=1 Tax=Clavelina lepadiformis TaxID=159417 RepID=UPI0040434184
MKAVKFVGGCFKSRIARQSFCVSSRLLSCNQPTNSSVAEIKTPFIFKTRLSSSSRNTMVDTSNPYISSSSRGLTKEIEIPVPWGIIAGKVLGDSTNPPVLCIHGWLDNCNTFDNLIPMLPKDKYFVFIDLPGHGLSSGIPLGMFYTTYDYIAVIERIVNHFKWKSFSFLSHSLGGNVSGVYSGTFPEKVDKLIILDAPGIFPMTPGTEAQMLRTAIESYAKFEKMQDKEPPVYTYDAARKKLLTANKSLNEEAADILLERGAQKLKDGKYVFVRDVRHNYRHPTAISAVSVSQFLSKIQAETMHIMAKDGLFNTIPKERQRVVSELIFDGFKSAEYYSRVDVEGKHHIHLCNPSGLIDHVSMHLSRPMRSGINRHQADASKAL